MAPGATENQVRRQGGPLAPILGQDIGLSRFCDLEMQGDRLVGGTLAVCVQLEEKASKLFLQFGKIHGVIL
jgi:hypothetical protein